MVRVVKKPGERKEEIVSAACELFISKGYEKTTMSDVMTQLNIAKGTIYHYFKSKEELLDAVIDFIADERFKTQHDILELTEGNGLERIQQLVRLSREEDRDYEEIIENLHQPANAGMHIRIIARHVSMQAPLYETLIRQGCDEGIFTTDNPLECAEFILSGIQFLTDIGVYPWTNEQLQRRVTAFPALIESLLSAPKDSFKFLQGLLD